MAYQKLNIETELEEAINEIIYNLDEYKKKSTDFTRNRKLPPATLIKVILNMQGNSLNAELLSAFPDMNERMSASAFEQAKAKLTPKIFQDILYKFNALKKTHKLLNKKYRLFAIDGTDFNVPFSVDSPFLVDSPNYKPKKDGTKHKAFCQVHANIMYDVLDREYVSCVTQPTRTENERDAAIDMLKNNNKEPFIVIMDRGYDGFNMIETCNRLDNCFYVIRTKAGCGGIKEIASLPNKEIDTTMTFKITTSSAEYAKISQLNPNLHLVQKPNGKYKVKSSSKTKYPRWDFEDNCTVTCRVVKFRINDPETGKEEWEVLLTNLSKLEFPLAKMKELYHQRWDIETSFRELKYALGCVNFHSKKKEFIEMELFAHLIMFNLVSRIIAMVDVPKKKTSLKNSYAIDFKMACTIIRKFFALHCTSPPLELIIEEISKYLVPIRPGRKDKRNMRTKTAVWFVYRVA